MRKVTVLTLGFSCLLVLPAMGQLGNAWTEFQFYSVDMQNYLLNNLSESLSSLEIRSQNALNNSTGELNIPNPVEAGKSFRQDIFFNPTTDKFENNPVIHSQAISDELNRLITRASVESIMGENGQLRLKSKLETTENSLDSIEALTESSDNIFRSILNFVETFAPQNPLVAIESEKGNLQLQAIKIQQEQAKIMAETLGQSIQTNQSLQYSNLNLVNISQQMSEINRSRRVDAATETARLIRTTSQVDLFSREEN
ncbi:hypothetical protein [Nodularia chucula]|uniref:hypothetical protein n=1 Tax=Nodularia chucula TaxID=3093667 RepID=UPI0039C667D7